MSNPVASRRWTQIGAWAAAGVLILGLFSPLVGAWTGALVGAWFIGTQKPARGFVWLTGFAYLPGLIAHARELVQFGAGHALWFAGWTLLIAVVNSIPFLFHRVVSPRLPRFLATLPLALAGAAVQSAEMACLPPDIYVLRGFAHTQQANAPLHAIGVSFGVGAMAFLVYWFGAAVLWMWNHEFRASRIAVGASLFAAINVLAAVYGLARSEADSPVAVGAGFAWVCFCAALVLAVWAHARRTADRRPWAGRARTLAMLRSPATGSPLHVAVESGGEVLADPSGERYAIRDGIAIFATASDLAGSNRKYNQLYESIAGFYDDFQRVWRALRGMAYDSHYLSYLSLLEVKPGDAVLETSVGTGLNLKYLPAGVRLFGLDLSPEMLARCRKNLGIWGLDADLFLGNAEKLPFAESSFDVVFHAGGINFFNDREAAIREMIRVAKPGSLLLIFDETDKHVAGIYERAPIVGRYFRDRGAPVSVPVDLVAGEMLDVRVHNLDDGEFYALTFRKPAAEGAQTAGA